MFWMACALLAVFICTCRAVTRNAAESAIVASKSLISFNVFCETFLNSEVLLQRNNHLHTNTLQDL